MEIHKKINTKGYYEQEQAYLFSELYQGSAKKLNRYEFGKWKEFKNNLFRGKFEK